MHVLNYTTYYNPWVSVFCMQIRILSFTQVSPGEYEPPIGDYLGELTDELNGNHILAFASGGPTNYAYKLARPDGDGNLTLPSQKYDQYYYQTSS